MPNAQRKKEYLRIYEDVARQNEILVSYLARRQNATVANGLLMQPTTGDCTREVLSAKP